MKEYLEWQAKQGPSTITTPYSNVYVLDAVPLSYVIFPLNSKHTSAPHKRHFRGILCVCRGEGAYTCCGTERCRGGIDTLMVGNCRGVALPRIDANHVLIVRIYTSSKVHERELSQTAVPKRDPILSIGVVNCFANESKMAFDYIFRMADIFAKETLSRTFRPLFPFKPIPPDDSGNRASLYP